jgi:ABC-type Fe3+/spermidine/putrescine transport system ATPase subunit
MTAIVTVDNLTKRFGETTAVDRISFGVAKNEFFSLLGPSGCGKTTTLRSVAGLESGQEGRIAMDTKVVFDPSAGIDLPANKRPIGMVFQSYAVWPHMTIFENIGYPLKVRGISKPDISNRVNAVLDMLGMAAYGGRMPSQLSGGQQQRVALGRALALNPTVLLLDEPLSNLDAKLRELMRAELKQVQRRTGLPILYVTHDQEEALAMSDRIAVMHAGHVHQIGDPLEIYSRPATRFVLDFIGTVSYLPCTIQARTDTHADVLWGGNDQSALSRVFAAPGAPAQGPGLIAVRPEDVTFSERSSGSPGGHTATGTVVLRAYLGDRWEYRVRVGETEIRLRVDKQTRLEEGTEVGLTLGEAVVLPAGDGAPTDPVWPHHEKTRL